MEDAATGSAALALGVWLVDRGRVPGEECTGYTVTQGVGMGRPSTLDCTVTATAGRATSATVRGSVAHLGTGELVVPGRS